MKRRIFSKRMAGILGSWRVRAAIVAGAVGVAILVIGPQVSGGSPATQPATQPAGGLIVKGTCTFGGKSSTWSAKLTLRQDGLYDADYSATWGGTPLSFKGTIKTDWKTTISGEGASKSNGTFQFAGKIDKNGVATCPYKEVGGRRAGSLTVTQVSQQ